MSNVRAKAARLNAEQLGHGLNVPARNPAPLGNGLRRDVARHGDALRGAPLLDDGSQNLVSHACLLTNGKRQAQEQSKRPACLESAYRSDMTSRPKTPAAIALGQRIKQLRENKGWSQPELARNLGVTNGAVGAWEVGLKSPRRSMAQKVAAMLGVTMEWLLTGNEPEERTKAQTKPELEALELVRALPPEKQDMAVAMLRGLAATDASRK